MFQKIKTPSLSNDEKVNVEPHVSSVLLHTFLIAQLSPFETYCWQLKYECELYSFFHN